MLAGLASAITAGRGALHELFKLRQDQIQRLQGGDLQCPLLEEVFERVGRGVACHLQDAFVHGKHKGAGWLVGLDLHFQHFTGFHPFAGREREVGRALAQTCRKRNGAVAQGAGVNFVRGRVAYKLHVDIPIALKIFGQRDVLHRCGFIGLEPGMGIDFVTLNRDQSGSGVGGLDAQLNLVTRLVVFLAELDLQFSIAVQRAGQVGSACHCVFHPVQQQAVTAAHLQRKVSRCGGVQSQSNTRSPQLERLLIQRDVFGA